MISTSKASEQGTSRTYLRSECVVFRKTTEAFGGLSNMAGGYPLEVNGIRILTAEALYQACRFPHRPEVQKLILNEASPMTAKMKGKPYRGDSRPDWDQVRVKIMRWCLRVKLAQCWTDFSRLLQTTGTRPIVEDSWKDPFWGAKPLEDGTLVGMNVLGRLLMELREELREKNRDAFLRLEPLAIPNFKLLGNPIETIEPGNTRSTSISSPGKLQAQAKINPPTQPSQPSLFQNLSSEAKAEEPLNTKNPPLVHGPLGLSPYPAYKNSDLPWLGEIPQGWEVRRNGRLFAQRNETGRAELPILEVSLRTGVRVRSFGEGERKQTMADPQKYKRAAKGDIAYNMMRMWQGALGVSPLDGLVSPAYIVAHPFDDVEAHFYAYLFRTDAYLNEVDKFSRGIVKDRNRLYWEDFKRIPSPYPPKEEQAAIVRFLDHADRRIRRAIRAKRRLIALLNEQKQVIIHQAVTQGIDPKAQMKPSGVDWLGDVPMHWETKKLKQLTRFQNGLAFKPGDWSSSGTPIIRIQNLNGSNEFNFTNREDLPEALIIKPGDLLFSWSGNRGTSFGSFIWDRDFNGILNQHIFKLFGFSLDRKYFAYLLRSVTKHVEEQTHGIIGLVHITKPELGAVVIPVAPPSEQNAIAAFIDEQLGKADRISCKAKQEIALLLELQTRLISDVVTGKLDVREAASLLSEEEGMAESADDNEAIPEDEEIPEDAESEEVEA